MPCLWSPIGYAGLVSCPKVQVDLLLLYASTNFVGYSHFGTLNSAYWALLHLSISIHFSNSFGCSMKFFLGLALGASYVACTTTEKHWCPVSTFSYFHGKAFLEQIMKLVSDFTVENGATCIASGTNTFQHSASHQSGSTWDVSHKPYIVKRLQGRWINTQGWGDNGVASTCWAVHSLWRWPSRHLSD